jgi:hypothetical protein
MYDDIAYERLAARRVYGVPAYRDHPAGLVHDLGRGDRPVFGLVGETGAEPQLGMVRHRVLTGVFLAAATFGSSTGSRDFALPVQRRRDQAGEQRVRLGRSRAQLRVRLGGHEYGCTDRSSSMNSTSSWSGDRPLNTRPGGLQLVAVRVVHLVAVAVPLLDRRSAVQAADDRTVGRFAGYRPSRIVPPISPGRRRCASAPPSSRSPAVGVGSNSLRVAPPGRPGSGRPRSPCTAGPGTAPGSGCRARGRTGSRRSCPR